MKALAIPLSLSPVRAQRWRRLTLRQTLKLLLGMVQVSCALVLILVSLWAILLPPLFPFSTHSLVNSQMVSIRAPEQGMIQNLSPVARGRLLMVGEEVASVARDLRGEQRELKEREFSHDKLTEQVAIIERSIAQREQRLVEMHAEAVAARQAARRTLEQKYQATVERIRLFRLEHAEKKADEHRIAPLFEDGIITSAQWAETRAQTLEAEKNLNAAESDLFMLKIEMESLEQSGPESLGDAMEGVAARIGFYEQEVVNLKIQRNALAAELAETQRQIEWSRTLLEAENAYRITTPISGVVWRQQVANGEHLIEGQTVLQVADTDSIFVEAYFRREFMNSIAVGDRAHVYLVAEGRFVDGRVADLQVQEKSASIPHVINTISTDASLLRATIEVEPGVLQADEIGQLAKVLVSRAEPGMVQRFLVRLSFLLRSHT